VGVCPLRWLISCPRVLATVARTSGIAPMRGPGVAITASPGLRLVSLLASRKRETKTRRFGLRSAGKAIGRSKFNASCAVAGLRFHNDKRCTKARRAP